MELSADSTSGSVKTSSDDAEDIVTGGKKNQGKPWTFSDEFVLTKAAGEMNCDWAKILTSKYSEMFTGRTVDEIRDHYEHMPKDKYEQMLEDAKKKEQISNIGKSSSKMLEAVLVRKELLRRISEKMGIAVNIMQEEEKEE